MTDQSDASTIQRNPSVAESVPAEFLLKLTCLLPQRDLITSLRISRAYHDAAGDLLHPTLFNSITINPSSSSGFSPLSTRSPEEREVDPYLPIKAHLSRFVGFVGVPNPFDYTTHLTLTSHSTFTCSSLSHLVLPNLITLRIKPGYLEDHGSLCGGRSGERNGGCCLTCGSSDPGTCRANTCCPLVTYLRPRRLILGGTTTHTIGRGDGFWSGAIPASVKELVILLGVFSGHPSTPPSPPSFCNNLPHTVEKITFVLSSANHGWDSFWDDTAPYCLATCKAGPEVDSAHFKLESPAVRTTDDRHRSSDSVYSGPGLASSQTGSLGYAGYTRYLPAHTQCRLAQTRTRTILGGASDLGPVPHSPAGDGYFPGIFQGTRTRARCYYCLNDDCVDPWNTVFLARAMFRVIVNLGMGQAVEIVGADRIDQCFFEEEGRYVVEVVDEEETFEEFLSREVRKALVAKGLGAIEADARGEKIIYTTEAEYKARENWLQVTLSEWDRVGLEEKFKGVWWGPGGITPPGALGGRWDGSVV